MTYPAPCSRDTINLLDFTNDLRTIHREDYDLLKASGYLWVFYPDAPDVWPNPSEPTQSLHH